VGAAYAVRVAVNTIRTFSAPALGLG
jgi:hypothetical protein